MARTFEIITQATPVHLLILKGTCAPRSSFETVDSPYFSPCPCSPLFVSSKERSTLEQIVSDSQLTVRWVQLINMGHYLSLIRSCFSVRNREPVFHIRISTLRFTLPCWGVAVVFNALSILLYHLAQWGYYHMHTTSSTFPIPVS